MLKGKKTYLVSLGGVLGAIAGYLTGETTVFETILIAVNSLGLASLRAGVKSDVEG